MKKEFRIKKSSEIEQMIVLKHSYGNKYFIIYIKESEINHFRCALSVGKKIGKAVKRVKLKRQIRSIIRIYKNDLKHVNLFIVAKPACCDLSFEEKRKQIEFLLKKLNILRRTNE